MRFRTLPLFGIGAQVSQIDERDTDASLVPQTPMKVEHFLILLFRLEPAIAHRTNIAQIAEGRGQRTRIAVFAVDLQRLRVVLVGARVITPRKVGVPLSIELLRR